MSADIAIIRAGPSRHDETAIGSLLNGIRPILITSAEAFLPDDFARRIQLHYPIIRQRIAIIIISFVPSADIAIIGLGLSRHDISAVGGLLNGKRTIKITSAE